MVARGQGTAGCRWWFAALFAVAALIPEEVSAQSTDPMFAPPRPPAPIGSPAPPPAVGLVTPGSPTVVTPPVAAPPAGAVPAAPAPPPAAQSSLVVPPGQVALMVSARFGRDPPAIPGALHWRVYADKPDANGVFRVIKEDRAASPTFVLPPGGYVVDVSFGLANLAKRGRRGAVRRPRRRQPDSGGPDLVRRLSRQPVRARRQAADGPGRRDRRIGAAAGGYLLRRIELRRRQRGDALRYPRAGRQAYRRDHQPQGGGDHAEARDRARRRGAGQHRLVGAHPWRRRHQGIDRRVSAGDPGGRRLRRDRPQRRQGLHPGLQGGARLRPGNRGHGQIAGVAFGCSKQSPGTGIARIRGERNAGPEILPVHFFPRRSGRARSARAGIHEHGAFCQPLPRCSWTPAHARFARLAGATAAEKYSERELLLRATRSESRVAREVCHAASFMRLRSGAIASSASIDKAFSSGTIVCAWLPSRRIDTVPSAASFLPTTSSTGIFATECSRTL